MRHPTGPAPTMTALRDRGLSIGRGESLERKRIDSFNGTNNNAKEEEGEMDEEYHSLSSLIYMREYIVYLHVQGPCHENHILRTGRWSG